MIYTDYKPLTSALKSKSDKHSPRAFHHLNYISQFPSDIRHISRVNNIPADALSCLPVCSITSPASIDLTAIARDQPSSDTFDLMSSKWSCGKLAYLPPPLSYVTIL